MVDKRMVLSKKYMPITNAQLKIVVADYLIRFPDWELFKDGTAFFRNHGPFQQMIWFQKMRSASYRPTHVISATVPLMPRMLTQILDVKHREVEHRWHEQKFASTLAAMEEQFRPNIRDPLNISTVLELCEAEAQAMPDTTNNMIMLAILYSWLNRKCEALDCCERIQQCPLPMPVLEPRLSWENLARTFGRDLAKALENGTAREFLETDLAPEFRIP